MGAGLPALGETQSSRTPQAGHVPAAQRLPAWSRLEVHRGMEKCRCHLSVGGKKLGLHQKASRDHFYRQKSSSFARFIKIFSSGL